MQYQIGAIRVSFIKMIFEEVLERGKRVYQANICRSVLEARGLSQREHTLQKYLTWGHGWHGG